MRGRWLAGGVLVAAVGVVALAVAVGADAERRRRDGVPAAQARVLCADFDAAKAAMMADLLEKQVGIVEADRQHDWPAEIAARAEADRDASRKAAHDAAARAVMERAALARARNATWLDYALRRAGSER